MELLPRWLPRPSPWRTDAVSYSQHMRLRLKKVLDDEWTPKSYSYAVNNPEQARNHRERADERMVRKIANELRDVAKKYDKRPDLAKRATERVLHFCFDRKLKSERKLATNISLFMTRSSGRRNRNARRAWNTVTAAAMGPTNSASHLTLKEFNRVLDTGRERPIWSLCESMRREWDTGKSPTFENPEARYDFRRHHPINIKLCEKWYVIFETFL